MIDSKYFYFSFSNWNMWSLSNLKIKKDRKISRKELRSITASYTLPCLGLS